MRKSGRLAVIILLVVTGIAVSAAINIPVLCITKQADRSTVYVSSIGYGERFAVEWMHSVELQPWTEIFEYTGDGICLRETRFKSFGAGVPDYGGKKFFIDDGYIVFSGFDIGMDELPLGVSSFAGHKLIFRQSAIPLSSLVEDGTYVKIRVDKASLLNFLYKKVTLWLR